MDVVGITLRYLSIQRRRVAHLAQTLDRHRTALPSSSSRPDADTVEHPADRILYLLGAPKDISGPLQRGLECRCAHTVCLANEAALKSGVCARELRNALDS